MEHLLKHFPKSELFQQRQCHRRFCGGNC